MKKKMFLFIILICLMFIGCKEPEKKPEISVSFSEDKIVLVENEVVLPLNVLGLEKDLVELTIDNNDAIEIVDGKIVAKGAGVANITATYEELSDTIKVVVPLDATITENIKIGEKVEVVLNNFEGDLFDFDIILSNDNLEIVNGEVVAKKEGSTEVTITYKDNQEITYTKEVYIEALKPILVADATVVEVDELIEFNVENYPSNDLFDFVSEDETIVEFFEDNLAFSLKPGKTVVKAVLKSNPSVYAEIEITVKFAEIEALISSNKIVAGQEFTINIYNYDDEKIFNFDISDTSVVEKTGEKTYLAKKEGTVKITITIKEDPSKVLEFDIVVYPIEPIISIKNNEIMVEGTVKLDLVNYNEKEKFVWQISDNELANFEDYIVTAKKPGELVVTVTSIDNPELTSKVNIKIIPIQPIVLLTSSTMKVGGVARLFINNLEKLETTDFEKFEVVVEDETIVKYENSLVTGLKEGTTKINLKSKENSQIKGSIEVVVSKTSSIRDDKGEIADGSLIIYAENPTSMVEAGEFLKLYIDGAVDQENYKWVSTDTSVATVNDAGRVIGVKAGTAQIAAISKTNQEVRGYAYVTVYGIPNVDYAARLVKIAVEELGYIEGPNNDTKYGAWYHLNYEPWCAMFVSWCANQAGIGTDIIPKYCGCTAGMKWFNDLGLFQTRESGYKPKAGDVIFFRDASETVPTVSTHTGIVYACANGRVYTIEGNTSDMCAKRSYLLTSTYIVGYGTPDYPDFEGEPAVFEPGNPESGEGLDTQ